MFVVEAPRTAILGAEGVQCDTDTSLQKLNNNNNNNNNIYLTAIGLSPGGSGFKHIYKYLTLCY